MDYWSIALLAEEFHRERGYRSPELLPQLLRLYLKPEPERLIEVPQPPR